MRVHVMRILMVTLLLVVSACSNEKEAQNTMEDKKVAKAAIETTNKTGTFMVLGMDCCPPSVVESVLKQVDGVNKTAINVTGSKGEVTVSFDEKRTDLQAIKLAVSDFGLRVE